MLLNMYLTMSPLIAGGIANMMFTKTTLYNKHKYPIDCGKCLKDGKRIFGDNKTFIGFFSMILFCALFQISCGLICEHFAINQYNDLYVVNDNSVVFNILFGALVGFVYMVCELPNSFIKRRLDVTPGKTGSGVIGVIFFVLDQIDSLIGVMLVLYLFSEISIAKYFAYVFIGGLTHIVVNRILYIVKVRRNV